ncbi:MAG: roadblock/LC7 domain-containing protein [Candidatus Methanoperedens sp.]
MIKNLEIVDKVLADLKKVRGIETCAVASRDGLLIRAIQQEGQNLDSFVAMSATLFGAAETAIAMFGKGIPSRVIIESDRGRVIAIGAGPKALLIVIVSLDTGLELILLELEKAAKKVKELLI